MYVLQDLALIVLSISTVVLGFVLFRTKRRERLLLKETAVLGLQLREKEALIVDKQEKLEGLLEIEPLRREMMAFRHLVSESFGEERREVYALKQTIESLMMIHHSMTDTAKGLADALRGNSKVRGNWGEMVLERVLECAGLQHGRDYVREGGGLDLSSETGQRNRPDVVVRLPRARHLVIDSKLNLIPYERFVAARDDRLDTAVAETCWREFTSALKTQVDALAKKSYADLKGLRSPDFVFLFVPLESAFVDLMERASWLFEEAARKGILVCSPVNLVAGLKLVAHLWSEERRNRHAEELATRAGRLYDKFRLCLDDIQALGAALDQAVQLQSRTLSRWTSGKESVAWQFEQLRKLGAPVKSKLGLDALTDRQAPDGCAPDLEVCPEGVEGHLSSQNGYAPAI
jgi:DNA recombination protein RmuC